MFTFLHYKRRQNEGFTLIEVLIATSVVVLIGVVVGNWFFMQRKFQKRIVSLAEAQENIRRANWRMIQELKTSRTIIYPRINEDKSIRSDSKVVFKNFNGDIVCYYHENETGNIRRCLIPNGTGSPQLTKAPIGKNFDRVIFTAQDDSNKLVGIFLEYKNTFGIESVFLLNE
jgi:prepilin-type N-terminal cleavage/methylation domain-containing protein